MPGPRWLRGGVIPGRSPVRIQPLPGPFWTRGGVIPGRSPVRIQPLPGPFWTRGGVIPGRSPVRIQPLPGPFWTRGRVSAGDLPEKLSLGVRPRLVTPGAAGPADRSAEAERAKFSRGSAAGHGGAGGAERAGAVRANDFDLASARRSLGTRRAGRTSVNFAPVPASRRFGAAPADADLNTASSRLAPTNSGLGARSATGRASPATQLTSKNANGVSSRSQAMAPGSTCLMAGPVTSGSDSSRPRPALPASPAAVAAAITPSSTHGLRSPVVAPDAAAILAAKYPARQKISAYSPA